MVEFGSSSMAPGQPTTHDGYAEEESFIAAIGNQHEETMFDDDITSALLNGINSDANTGAVTTAHNNQLLLTTQLSNGGNTNNANNFSHNLSGML